MATTISTDLSKFMIAGLDKYFSENWTIHPAEYKQWTKVRAFQKLVNYLQNMGNLAVAEEITENNPIPYDTLNESVQTSLTLKQYGQGVSFSWLAQKGDLYGVIDEGKMKELMNAMVRKLEALAIKPWDEAFDTNQADGAPMCSSTKPCLESGDTYITKLASGGTLDASGTGATNIKTALQYMAKQKNAMGQPFVAKANTIGTHAANQVSVEALFGSTLVPFVTSTAGHLQTANTLPRMAPVYSHYLAQDDYWFIWDNDIDHVVSGHFADMPSPQTETEKDFDTKALKANVVYGFGVASLPNAGIVGSSGA